ncbi:MAG TPA: tRNA (adenosine(37)-N6)-dimethylallyltransferase MiaA [Acidimicrobiales bacterium]|nr:tRNA (adenosine(37)-N6)-dimethylallyltransferase MiaA [Acidimicrobiales bacterium]
MTKPLHLALVGPTASGKSAVALEVARTLPGPPVEIVTADSMQVYRGMDIGTAKPTAVERADVPHHLLDVTEPADDFSVARYQRAADEVLDDVEARGRRALLVGGTGLYVQAVVDRLDVPGRWPEVRADVEREPDTVALWRRLQQADPVAAERIVPTNRRRVVRALEVTLGSGTPFSSFGPGIQAFPPSERFRLAGVWLPRAAGVERIRTRLTQMLDAGLLDEVRALARNPMSRTARQALGYRELLGHLAGDCTLDEAIDTTVRRTIAFARRQRVWFRRDPRITWYGTDGNPLAVVPALLRDWSVECS